MSRAARVAAGEWKRLGVNVYDDMGSMRNMADIIGDIEKALKGMSDEQKINTLSQMKFQDRSKAYTMALIGMSSKIRQHEAELRSRLGTSVADIAEAQMKSFTNQWTMIKNRLEIVAEEIGNRLSPMLESIREKISGLITELRYVNPEFQILAIKILAVAAAIGPVILLLGTLSRVSSIILPLLSMMFSSIKLITVGLGSMMAAIMSPVGLILLSLVLMAAGIAALTGAFKNTNISIEGMGNSLKEFLDDSIGFFINFKENWKILIEYMETSWNTMFENMSKGMGAGIDKGLRKWLGLPIKNIVDTASIAINHGVLAAGQGVMEVGNKFFENANKYNIIKNNIKMDTGLLAPDKTFFQDWNEKMLKNKANNQSLDKIREGQFGTIANMPEFKFDIPLKKKPSDLFNELHNSIVDSIHTLSKLLPGDLGRIYNDNGIMPLNVQAKQSERWNSDYLKYTTYLDSKKKPLFNTEWQGIDKTIESLKDTFNKWKSDFKGWMFENTEANEKGLREITFDIRALYDSTGDYLKSGLENLLPSWAKDSKGKDIFLGNRPSFMNTYFPSTSPDNADAVNRELEDMMSMNEKEPLAGALEKGTVEAFSVAIRKNNVDNQIAENTKRTADTTEDVLAAIQNQDTIEIIENSLA
jgi:hypothetical protein